MSGDVGEHGDPAEYALARELLAPLPMPVHVLAGNHDDPEALSEAFGTPARYTAEVGELALVACDTPLPGRLEGELDLDWLEAQLEATRGRPVVVAMHHPPLLTGIPVLDEIGLPAQQRAALGRAARALPGRPPRRRGPRAPDRVRACSAAAAS